MGRKSARTVVGPAEEIVLDKRLGQVNVEGEVVVAEASTAQLNVTEQLVYLTRYLTLGPGDVVLTGAPATFAPVKPGDRTEITLDGIGTLTNPVRSR